MVNGKVGTMRGPGVVILSILSMGLLLGGGCSGCDSDLLGDACRYTMVISPDQAPLPINTTLQLKATVTLGDCSRHDVTALAAWESSDTSVATINDDGDRGLAKGVALGISNIRARVVDLEATAVVLVTPAPIVSIAVTPDRPATARGGPLQFVALGTFQDGSVLDITSLSTWSSSNPAVATVSSESGSKGLAVGLEPGVTTISASFTEVSGSTELSVTPAALMLVSVWPPIAEVTPGMSQQFTATAIYDDFSTQDVTSSCEWASALEGVATVSTGAPPRGLAQSVGSGDTPISARLFGVSGSALLRVSTSTIQDLRIVPAQPVAAAGTSIPLAAVARWSDHSVHTVTHLAQWNTDDSNVATVSNETGAKGVTHAVAPGTTLVGATVLNGTGTTEMTVTDAALTALMILPALPTVVRGTTVSLTATGYFSDNTTQDLTAVVQWSSGNPGAATVDARGLVTAHAPGTSSITAQHESVRASIQLGVTDARLLSISVTPTHPQITIEAGGHLTATGLFSDDTVQDLTSLATWISSDDMVVRVSNAAGLRGDIVGMTSGNATVTACFDGVQGFTHVVVSPATLVSIRVVPDRVIMANGTRAQLHAEGEYSDNVTRDLTSLVSWSSNHPEVVSVSSTAPTHGELLAQKEGTSTITAALGGMSGHGDVLVTNAQLTELTITPQQPSIAKGTYQRFAAFGSFSDGSTQDLSSSVTWRSSHPAVASISNSTNQQGLAQGLDLGTSTITASFGSRNAETLLTVRDAGLQEITVEPAVKLLANGTSQNYVATGIFTDGTTQDLTTAVTWLSAQPEVADISNVPGSQGLATAIAPGTTTITASFGSTSGTAQLTVTNATLRAIAVIPQDVVLPRGGNRRLTALRTFTDNSTEDITSLVSWSSSDTNIANMSRTTQGMVHGRAEGMATITASHLGAAGTTRVTVEPKTMVTIMVSPGFTKAATDTSVQFRATALYSDNSTDDITASVVWASSDLSLATVSNGGETRGKVQTERRGTAIIYASASGMIGYAFLEISRATLSSITIQPQNATIIAGHVTPLQAIGSFSDGTQQDISDVATWSSSHTSRARVSNTSPRRGWVTGVAPGSVTIEATLAEVTGQNTVQVATATLQSITLQSQLPSLPQGMVSRLEATAVFSNGHTADVTRQVQWTSSSSAVITVTEGLARARTEGTAIITAALSGLSGQITLEVTPTELTTLSITPATASIPIHGTQDFQATGTFSNGSILDVTDAVTWLTADPVCSISNAVDSSGTAYGLMPGPTTIRAVMNLVEATAELSVGP